MERNSDLMLLLAYLLTRNPDWRDAKVEVMSVASSEVAGTRSEVELKRLLPRIRIEAEIRVIVKPKDLSVAELIQQESADAEVVFLGLGAPDPGEEANYAQRLETLAGDLPVVFFVKNASMFVGELLEAPAEESEDDGVDDDATESADEPASDEIEKDVSRSPRPT